MSSMHLNRKLTLEALQRVADGAGGYDESWARLGTHWARLRSGKGRVRAVGAAALSQVPTEIVVRAAPPGSPARPAPEQRFRDGARCWRVLAVSELDPQGRYLRCDTLEEAVA